MNSASSKNILIIGTLGFILVLITAYRLVKPDLFSNRQTIDVTPSTQVSEPARSLPVTNNQTTTTSAEPAPVVPVRMALSGTTVCLPHIDQTTQSKECALGLKTDDNIYYSLDYNQMSATKPELLIGDQLKANGIFTPIEMLSSEFLRKTYPVRGIFSVTDIIR